MKHLFLLVLGFVLVGSLAIWLTTNGARRGPAGLSGGAERLAHGGGKRNLDSLWPAPDFAFSDQRGATVSKQSLGGRPWVANFIFTTCRTICPLLTTKMVRLQRELAEVPVSFVSFSVDPRHDTQQALADYARQWNAEEQRWHLLRTSEESLPEVAAGFHIVAQPVDGGIDPVMHSSVFVLVDAEGVVRGVYDSEDASDFHALAGAVRSLAQAEARAGRAPRTGEQLYREFSCANCHDHPSLAPHLGGVWGQKRELDSSLVVTADEAYLRESILAPDAKRLKGYPLRMPSYHGHLSNAELDALVSHLKTLPSPAPTAPAEVKVDPVCHMEVRATPDALRWGEVYFCSQACRERYAQNPEAFR